MPSGACQEGGVPIVLGKVESEAGRPRRARGAGAGEEPPSQEPGDRQEESQRRHASQDPRPAQCNPRARTSDGRVREARVDRLGGERPEGEGKVPGGLEPLARSLLETSEGDPLQVGRQRCLGFRKRRRVLLEHRVQRFHHRVPVEGPLPGQHLVEHAAEGEDVGAPVCRLPASLLRREIAHGAEDGARGGALILLQGAGHVVTPGLGELDLGEAEVQDLHPAVLGHEEVVRLEVPVDDPLLVGSAEALGHLHSDVHGLPHGQGAIPEPVPQRSTLEVLHDGVRDVALPAEIVERKDVRVGERGNRLGLALEPGESVRVFRELLRQDLHRHFSAEARVLRPVHLAHAACAEGREDLVGTELRAGLQHHRAPSTRKR